MDELVMNERMEESMIGWINGWINVEWMGDLMNGWMNSVHGNNGPLRITFQFIS